MVKFKYISIVLTVNLLNRLKDSLQVFFSDNENCPLEGEEELILVKVFGLL